MTIIKGSHENVNTIFIQSMYQQSCLSTLLQITMYRRTLHSHLSRAYQKIPIPLSNFFQTLILTLSSWVSQVVHLLQAS